IKVNDDLADVPLGIGGEASLEGTLQISLPAENVPKPGRIFTLIAAAHVSGVFDAVTYSGPNCVEPVVAYTNDPVTLTFIAAPCPADVAPPSAGDGRIDVDDLIAIILHWGTCGSPKPCSGDTDCSSVVDVDDLINVLVNWGPCP